MKTSLKCTHPEEIEYTITIVGTAKEFETLRRKIDRVNDWPLWAAISDVLKQANRTFSGGNNDN